MKRRANPITHNLKRKSYGIMHKVQTVQHWKTAPDNGYDEDNLATYNRVKAGKEYWLEMGEVWVCRRGPGKWAIGHKCNSKCLYAREVRKGRGDDSFSYCTACKTRLPARNKVEEIANKMFPDLDTIRFLAELASIGNKSVVRDGY